MDHQQPSTSGEERKKKRSKKFQHKWLGLDNFKDWLTSHDDDTKAFCSVCDKVLASGKADLLRHQKSQKHLSNIAKSRNENSENTSVLLTAINSKFEDHAKKVKITEIRMSAFFATHNIAFEIVDDLVPLLKHSFTDSQIAKDLTLSRKKCTQIINNVLGKRESERIISNLVNTKFSILVDESTSITNDKVLCVLVKYFSVQYKKVVTELLELIALDATDCSAEKIYSAFEHCLKSKQINYQVQHDSSYLKTECPEFLIEVKSKCLDFYTTSLEEILQRLPYNDEIFRELNFLDDKNRSNFPDLTNLANRLDITDIMTLAHEWRDLLIEFNDADKISLSNLEIDEMWKIIFEKKDYNDEPSFPNLEKLVYAALSLPHSNAEAERIFSIVTDVKNKKRNRISTTCLDSICKLRSSFQAHNLDSHSFQVDSRHLELHNAKNLYCQNKTKGYNK
ncbi:hypothetical protein ALC62_13298 [Cyphomyrmex costatus]|uniref:HAT C-terminal dimerisation domain-containing protein n=1 Tax=Cyphomyrmex costatus TaxID=456900 RepID=A0A151IA50_9HYME|nr:hypothetical protein ALC62_13298 [Cyphomyrmex costatus]